jgi:uncharacterized protein (DUF433 family)
MKPSRGLAAVEVGESRFVFGKGSASRERMLESSRSMEATMDWRDHIELNPDVLLGKPVLKGTRLSVEFVLDLVATGVPEVDILANYPRLTRGGILACVAYASDLVRSERVFPLSA